jgi:acyl-CoA thioester hydrolase
MRWADMDMLGHVNNVRYLDYVAEARENFLDGRPVVDTTVARHKVEFVAPLVFRRRPVLVDSWFTDAGEDSVTLAHEVYDAPESADAERTVYLRVSSALATGGASLAPAAADLGPDHTWRPVLDGGTPGRAQYQLTVRRADIDERGFVRDVAFFEYFQEARIQFLMNLHTRGQKWSHHVVARTDIDYLEPVPHRREPYAVRSWIGHVGTRSFTIRAELLDGERVMTRVAVVMVTFDKETQRPREMAPEQRERLLEELR